MQKLKIEEQREREYSDPVGIILKLSEEIQKQNNNLYNDFKNVYYL